MTHQEYESHLSRIEQLIHVDFDQPSSEFDELMGIAEQVWEYEETIPPKMTIPTTTSGCKAMDGCTRKVTCLRYQIYQAQDQYKGWSAWQMCKISEFVVNDYPHFIEVKEQKDED